MLGFVPTGIPFLYRMASVYSRPIGTDGLDPPALGFAAGGLDWADKLNGPRARRCFWAVL